MCIRYFSWMSQTFAHFPSHTPGMNVIKTHLEVRLKYSWSAKNACILWKLDKWWICESCTPWKLPNIQKYKTVIYDKIKKRQYYHGGEKEYLVDPFFCAWATLDDWMGFMAVLFIIIVKSHFFLSRMIDYMTIRRWNSG